MRGFEKAWVRWALLRKGAGEKLKQVERWSVGLGGTFPVLTGFDRSDLTVVHL